MSRTGSGRAARAEERREPLGMPTLLLWRRIGLAAGAGAVLCVLTGLALLVIRDEAGVAVGLLLVAAFVCAWACLRFLQRAWSEPVVADDPRVVRARSWSTAATVSWCVAVLPGLAVRVLPESFEWLRWLVLVLGAIAVVAFLGMLVLTARWRLPRA